MLAASLLLWACGALAGSDPVHEYLDEETGATITVLTQPLVFAYARKELAANARDYVNLEAAAVNRGGKMSYVLIAYFWSTVDPRQREEPLPTPDPLVLQADDRRIALSKRGQTPREAGIGVPFDAPSGAEPNVYPTDLATLRSVSEARHLAVSVDTESSTLTYDLWEDRRNALKAFVQRLSGVY